MYRLLILSLFLLLFSSFSHGKDLLTYLVKKEDTLLELCDIFKISREQLLKHNPQHKIDRFWAGDTIKIPLVGLKVLSYNVKSGDSLFELIEKYHLDVEALYMLNDKAILDRMWKGDKLKLPVPLKTPQISIPKPQKNPSKSKIMEYKVRPGDSFYLLSKRFDIPVSELESLNPHSILMAGTTLKIPLRFIEKSLLQTPISARKVSLNLNLPGIHYLPSSRGSIQAPLTGKISGIRHIKGFGKAIFIQNKKISAILASKGFDSILVSYGSTIKAGQPLAVIREKYHLHFFVLRDSRFIDPQSLIKN